MRVFVLCTGRCGSLTLARALGAHVTSHTVGHESRAHLVHGRLDYPEHHVEVDNRLAWHLGELGQRFGDVPVYVHLARDPEQVAASYARRFHIRAGIMGAYASGIVRGALPRTDAERLAAARAMVATVTANIEQFLTDRPRVARMDIEDPEPGLREMWELAGFTGDRDAALASLSQVHNPTRGRTA